MHRHEHESTNRSRQCLLFDGDDIKYQLWEVKFLGYMRQRKLYEVITSCDDTPDEAKHADAFTELVQCLMNKTINFREHDLLHQHELYVQ